MKKELLDIADQDELIIAEGEVDPIEGVSFSFDFNNKILTSTPNKIFEKPSTYIISKELVNAVNAAIITGRPLLLKGEPGCGKTQLAKAVAWYFYEKEKTSIKDVEERRKKSLSPYYFEWFVKSTSKAREGAYIFDHVSRLRDTTVAGSDKKSKERAQDPRNYISLGPMGLAFTTQAPEGKLPILLIDEIDKGNIDFPNDLLLELDEMRFEIKELEQKDKFIKADKANRPLVFITSNDERELPAAFLRRCLYFKIPPFGEELLTKIVHAKLGHYYQALAMEKDKELSAEEVLSIVKKFRDIKSKVTATKPPSTSELLDWIQVILYKINQGEKLDALIADPDLQALALKLMN